MWFAINFMIVSGMLVCSNFLCVSVLCRSFADTVIVRTRGTILLIRSATVLFNVCNYLMYDRYRYSDKIILSAHFLNIKILPSR